ncbi:hypothetical protein ACFLTH_07410 [Bacteroidota bacterium]
MKTLNALSKNLSISIFTLILFVGLSTSTKAQETDSTETLFGGETKIGFIYGIDLKTNSIQDEIGTLTSFYGGTLLNRSLLLGLAVGANISHPDVNYSYIGFMAQLTFNPQELFHASGQVVFSYAQAKDYLREKTSLFDDFLNTNGASFYFLEPGANLEVNISNSVRLVAGLSYRIAFGLDEENEHIALTNVNNSDMSGLNFNLGVKVGIY